MPIITGTEQDDTLNGGSGDDMIYGHGGNDVITELVGTNDQLFGEDGDDRLIYRSLTAGSYTALLEGGAGNDRLEAIATYNDLLTLRGGDGHDRLIASGGGDITIDGGADSDLLQVDPFGNLYRITLGGGSDIVLLREPFPAGGIEIGDFATGDGGDVINLMEMLPFGFPGNPFANGQLRLLQSGADTIIQIDFDGLGGPFQIETGIVLKNVTASSLTGYNLGGYAPDGSTAVALTLSGSADVDFLSGNSGDDLIAGLGGNDVLFGSSGNDRLEGGEGNDEMFGQLGNDTMIGGLGDDVYHVGSSADIVVEAAGQGDDRVFTNASFALAADAEVEMLAAEFEQYLSPFALTGSDGANRIVGNAGTNVLDGRGGNDVLEGGDGDDTLIGGAGDDRLEGGQGQDRLGGGADSDTFVFSLLRDSKEQALRSDGTKTLSDVVTGFVAGEDRIDVSAIDAITGTGANDAFSFIGTGAFGHQAGELRYEVREGQAFIQLDVDGNGISDMSIMVTATPLLQATDFIL